MTRPAPPQIPVGGNSLRRRALSSLAVLLYRHAVLALLFLAVLTAGAAWRLSHLNLKEELRTDIPRSGAEKRAWESIQLAAPSQEPVHVVLYFNSPQPHSPERRREVAQSFLDAFNAPVHVAGVVEVRPAELSPQAPGPDDLLVLLRPGDIEALKALESPGKAGEILQDRISEMRRSVLADEAPASFQRDDPLRIFAGAASRQRPNPGPYAPGLDKLLPVAPGSNTIVLRLSPKYPATKLFYSLRLHNFLKATVEALGERNDPNLSDVQVAFYGRHIQTARTAQMLSDQLLLAGVILALCLIFLLILSFRKVESIFFIGIPPFIALIWTYGLTTWFAPDMDFLVVIMPIFMLGLGAEFSLQIYHRFIQELYRTRRYYPALSTAYIEAGRGVLVATVVTAGVFFSLALSPISFLRQFSLVCGTATFMMAAAALLALPPMAAIKSLLAGNKVTPVETFGFGMRRISAAVAASPRAALTVGLIVTVYLAYFSREIQLDRETGLDLTLPAGVASQPEEYRKEGTAASVSFLVEGASLQEVLGENDRLYQNILDLPPDMVLESVASLSTVLPSRALQQKVRLDLQRLDLAAIESALESAGQNQGFEPGHFQPFIDRLKTLRKAARRTEPVDLESTSDPDVVRTARKLIIHDGEIYRVLTVVVPAPEARELLTFRFNTFYKQISQGSFARPVRVNSEAMQNRRVSRNVIWAMALTVMLSVFWLSICLALHFRGRLMDTLLALLPLGIAAIWAFGLLIHLDIRVGLYALLIYPIALGISTTQAILLLQRINERGYASLRQAVRVSGRSNIIGASMHVLALGCLVQINSYALREMSFMALLAIVFGTVTTMMFIPSIMEIRREGGLAAWSPLEE
ncbi:MAG: MMPL family transporter [Candidatus Sumerlaeota bacterium]